MEIVDSTPTYAELELQVRQLEAEVERLRTGGVVVADMMEKLKAEYKPAANLQESTEQFTTEDLVRRFAMVAPWVTPLLITNIMKFAGFTVDQVSGEFFWLLKSG